MRQIDQLVWYEEFISLEYTTLYYDVPLIPDSYVGVHRVEARWEKRRGRLQE